MKFVETSYTNKKEILKFPDHYVAVAVTVDSEGITANEDGKKIVKAGTIVGGKTNPVLSDESQVVVKKNTSETAAKAEGILLEDVDVTYGNVGGAMLIHGFINSSKLPEQPETGAVTALKQITFIR